MRKIDEQKKKITEAAAARIRQLRLEKGCSQEEVSLTVGINPAYYGQVERGLKCPTIDTLYKISLALDVSLPELMRVDMGAVQSSELERLKNLLALVPSEKREQVFAAFESIVKLLTETKGAVSPQPLFRLFPIFQWKINEIATFASSI